MAVPKRYFRIPNDFADGPKNKFGVETALRNGANCFLLLFAREFVLSIFLNNAIAGVSKLLISADRRCTTFLCNVYRLEEKRYNVFI